MAGEKIASGLVADKEFAVIESMTTINGPFGSVARIWRAEDEVKDYYNNGDLSICFFEHMDMSGRDVHARLTAAAQALARMPRVNAVEVKDGSGNGIVLYREWP